jgi:hypothetical protein
MKARISRCETTRSCRYLHRVAFDYGLLGSVYHPSVGARRRVLFYYRHFLLFARAVSGIVAFSCPR